MLWQRTLTAIRSRKLEMARLDPRRGMPILPPVGATARQISSVERKLGRPLPPTYRDFLAMHDGWPDFLHGTNLLGVHHLSRGTFDGLARAVVDLGEITEPNSRTSLRMADDAARFLVPFGIDPEGETVFAWDTRSEGDDGELEIVVWVNDIGARVDGFPSFLEFVDAVLEAELFGLRAEGREPARARPHTRFEGARSVGGRDVRARVA